MIHSEECLGLGCHRDTYILLHDNFDQNTDFESLMIR
jgi:hypothetical protein